MMHLSRAGQGDGHQQSLACQRVPEMLPQILLTHGLSGTFCPGIWSFRERPKSQHKRRWGDARIPAASGCPALHLYSAEHEGLRVHPAPPWAACTASAEGGASQCGALVRTPRQERACEQLRSALK